MGSAFPGMIATAAEGAEAAENPVEGQGYPVLIMRNFYRDAETTFGIETMSAVLDDYLGDL